LRRFSNLKLWRLLAAGAIAAGIPTALGANPVSATALTATLTPQAVHEIVKDVNRLVRTHYIFPEKADAIAGRLTEGLVSGRYTASEPDQLVNLVSRDLRVVSNDKHLFLIHDPERAAGAQAGIAEVDTGQFRRELITRNHGIAEMKVLPGNVRYLRISQWLWDERETPRALDGAMRFLNGGDAYIIDIRGNSGGSGEAVNYLASHFLPPGEKMMIFRNAAEKISFYSVTDLPEGRLPSKPLFLLVDERSASASEELAAHVKNFRLGTLIGETTSGAGHPAEFFPVAHGFLVSISIAEITHAATGKGWEATGVAPHVEVPSEEALNVAHLQALQTVLKQVEAERQPEIEWLIPVAAARSNQPTLTSEQLARFAGNFERNIVISERDGRLFFQQQGSSERALVPMAENLFAIGNLEGGRMRFLVENGAVVGIEYIARQGSGMRINRLG
jgi:hypothetical protein